MSTVLEICTQVYTIWEYLLHREGETGCQTVIINPSDIDEISFS